MLFLGEAVHEQRGQRGDFIFAFAQRRQADLGDAHAVHQVASEAALLDERVDVHVGGRDDADFDVLGAGFADGVDFGALEKPEQLGLDGRVEVGDFVHEQGAALGGANHAGERVDRAGERAAAVAEELAFDEVFGQRGAIERDERPAADQAVGVNQPRDDFLAGAGFPGDEDGDVGGGQTNRDPSEFGHARRPEHGVVAFRQGQRGPEALVAFFGVAIGGAADGGLSQLHDAAQEGDLVQGLYVAEIEQNPALTILQFERPRSVGLGIPRNLWAFVF